MAIKITEPGIIYGIDEADYHGDPWGHGPSFVAHDIQTLVDTTPLHVWMQHPRLNPEVTPYDKMDRTLEEGAALHKLILGAGRDLLVVDSDAYRSNAAKQARVDAHANNRTPVLAERLVELHAIAGAVRDWINRYPHLRDVIEAPGKAEVAMFWEEEDLACRSLTDWLPDDPSAPLVDFKFTKIGVGPSAYERQVRESYALRSAHYLRGAHKLRGVKPEAYWLVACEMEAPHGVMVHTAGPALLETKTKLWREAITTLRQCQLENHWPCYPGIINEVEAKPWDLSADETALMQMHDQRKKREASMSVKHAHQLAKEIGGPLA